MCYSCQSVTKASDLVIEIPNKNAFQSVANRPLQLPSPGRGGCLPRWVFAQRGCLNRGVSARGSAQERSAQGGSGDRVCLRECLPRRGCLPRMTDWQTGVKTLPCHNYVADGKNEMANGWFQTVVSRFTARNLVREGNVFSCVCMLFCLLRGPGPQLQSQLHLHGAPHPTQTDRWGLFKLDRYVASIDKQVVGL